MVLMNKNTVQDQSTFQEVQLAIFKILSLQYSLSRLTPAHIILDLTLLPSLFIFKPSSLMKC